MLLQVSDSDPDMDKVRKLVKKLGQFYWSLQLPQHCVLPDGSGIGRIAYDDMAAFNLAWCYHRPTDQAGHSKAITSAVLLRNVLDVKHGTLTLRDAVMLLSPDAFSIWLSKYRSTIETSLYEFIATAAANRKTL